MTEFQQGLLIAIIASLVASVVSSYLAVRLSMKQFYIQKRWEIKAEAYSQIMEHLSFLKYSYVESMDAALEKRELSDKLSDILVEGHLKSKVYLAKASSVGAYTISDDVSSALEALMRELDKREMGYIGTMEARYKAVNECIYKVRECAKAELKQN